MVCFAVQACSLLLLCLLLSSLSVYCALSCCSGLSSVAVVLVLSSLLVYFLCFAFSVCCCVCAVYPACLFIVFRFLVDDVVCLAVWVRFPLVLL